MHPCKYMSPMFVIIQFDYLVTVYNGLNDNILNLDVKLLTCVFCKWEWPSNNSKSS